MFYYTGKPQKNQRFFAFFLCFVHICFRFVNSAQNALRFLCILPKFVSTFSECSKLLLFFCATSMESRVQKSLFL